MAVTAEAGRAAAAPPGFEAAFRRLHPRAVAVARRVLGDDGRAEEVAAEALVRAYVRWGRIQDLPHLDGWVLRVTTNLALDVAKRKPPPAPSPVPSAEEADLVAVRGALVAALAQLPGKQRDAVALRYLGDLSEAEVAAAMGVSPGTVKTHLHRGTQALRRGLGPTFAPTFDEDLHGHASA